MQHLNWYVCNFADFDAGTFPGSSGVFAGLWEEVNQAASAASPTPPSSGILEFSGIGGDNHTMQIELLRGAPSATTRHEIAISFSGTGQKSTGATDCFRVDSARLTKRADGDAGLDVRGFQTNDKITFSFQAGNTIAVIPANFNQLNAAFLATSSTETAVIRRVTLGFFPGGTASVLLIGLMMAAHNEGVKHVVTALAFQPTPLEDQVFEVDVMMPPGHDAWLEILDQGGTTARMRAALGVEFEHVLAGQSATRPGKHYVERV